ncbi:MAG: hypothetical protein HQL69_16945 [Magnetococcales bacterium]|nr:hypothetical protein [Magnetococcales bacterium]
MTFQRTSKIFLLFALILGFISLSVVAAKENPVIPTHSLWIASKKSILILDVVSGEVQNTINSANKFHSLAVDSHGGKVWAYGNNQLSAFDLDGILLFQKSVPYLEQSEKKHVDDDDKKAVSLHVEPENGGVWLARGHLLQFFSENGELLNSTTFKHKIVATAIDPDNSLLWLAEHKSSEIRAYDT